MKGKIDCVIMDVELMQSQSLEMHLPLNFLKKRIKVEKIWFQIHGLYLLQKWNYVGRVVLFFLCLSIGFWYQIADNIWWWLRLMYSVNDKLDFVYVTLSNVIQELMLFVYQCICFSTPNSERVANLIKNFESTFIF